MEIEGRSYELEYDPQDPFISSGLTIAYCARLAEDFKPVLLDPRGHGSRPYPPEFTAYRLVVDSKRLRLSVLYEVYWRRQDCTWWELNKDHDHDYEQIQIHFDMKSGKMEKVVVSSVGLPEHAGHGLELYSNTPKAECRDVQYATSARPCFPWGGEHGQNSSTQIREIPIRELAFENGRPVVEVVNCYHVFAGLKKNRLIEKRKELHPTLRRLSRELLETWYYRHAKNRFGHDISRPFDEPYIMYYPPPEDIKSRLAYSVLCRWISFKRLMSSLPSPRKPSNSCMYAPKYTLSLRRVAGLCMTSITGDIRIER